MSIDDLTPTQRRIIDAIAESDNGTAIIEASSGNLSSVKSLAAKNVVEFETTDDGISVTLVTEKKGKRPVWDLALARNADGEPCKRNEEGQLAEVPHNFPKGHYPLGKGQFTETALWFDWKVVLADAAVESAKERAATARRKAKEAREGVSAETMLAKIRARRQKMLDKFADEEAALVDQIAAESEDNED